MLLVRVFPTSPSLLSPQLRSQLSADKLSENVNWGPSGPLFLYPQLTAWPDQLDRNDLIQPTELPADQKAAALFRLGEFDRAESLLSLTLLIWISRGKLSPLVSLAWMRLENRDLPGFQSVFRTLQRTWPDQPEVRAVVVQIPVGHKPRPFHRQRPFPVGVSPQMIINASFSSSCMRNG